jgi:hypothetical protein
VPSFAASGEHSVNLPYQGNYSFAITGLAGGETVTNAAVSNIVMHATGAEDEKSVSSIDYIKGYDGTSGQEPWSATENNANTSGVAIQKMTIYPNNSTIDRTQVAKWTGSQSGKVTTMTFVQAAHPLFMQITSLVNNASNGVITLTRYNDDTHTLSNHWASKYGWMCSGKGKAITAATEDNYIEVYRNGSKLNWATALTNGNDFTFANEGKTAITAEITIKDKLQPGDVIEVVLKTGDAPKETVTARYDGMYFVTPSESIQYGQTGYTVPTVKNANGAITYTSSDTAVATVDGSGAITTAAPGKTTITATDATGNKATFELTVTKQDTEITSFSDDTSSATETSSGTTVYTFSPAIKGKLDATIVTGSITYELVSAMTGSYDVTSAFTIVGNVLKTASSVSGSNYKIKVKAKGTVTNSKYENPEDITVTITYK